MTIWYIIGGVVSLLIGGFLFLIFLAVTAFSVGFGGDSISGPWFLIPAGFTFGGPYLVWFYLPKRRRAKRRGTDGGGR
jgi:hypothetical protein